MASTEPTEMLLQSFSGQIAELQEFRDIANTYTPNGTASELQACVEACEELTVPEGWSSWDEETIFTLATDAYGYEDFITDSLIYQEMVDEKDYEIEKKDEEIANLKAEQFKLKWALSEIETLEKEIQRFKAPTISPLNLEECEDLKVYE